jgi:hypothetical protein
MVQGKMMGTQSCPARPGFIDRCPRTCPQSWLGTATGHDGCHSLGDQIIQSRDCSAN